VLDPGQPLQRRRELVGRDERPGRVQLVQQQLQPQLGHLVLHDEQQLVVLHRLAARVLCRQQGVEVEVGAVRHRLREVGGDPLLQHALGPVDGGGILAHAGILPRSPDPRGGEPGPGSSGTGGGILAEGAEPRGPDDRGGLRHGHGRPGRGAATVEHGGQLVEAAGGERCCGRTLFGIHAAHGVARQVEVLRGVVLHLLQDDPERPGAVTGVLVMHRGKDVEVHADGKHLFGPEPALVVVANAPEYGTGFTLNPNATSNDGTLDLTVFSMKERMHVLSTAWAAVTQTVGNAAALMTTATSIDILGDSHAQIDGEAFGRTPIRIELLPFRQRFIVPA